MPLWLFRIHFFLDLDLESELSKVPKRVEIWLWSQIRNHDTCSSFLSQFNRRHEICRTKVLVLRQIWHNAPNLTHQNFSEALNCERKEGGMTESEFGRKETLLSCWEAFEWLSLHFERELGEVYRIREWCWDEQGSFNSTTAVKEQRSPSNRQSGRYIPGLGWGDVDSRKYCPRWRYCYWILILQSCAGFFQSSV